jgi:hypothetical protein
MTTTFKPYTTWGKLYGDIRKNAAARNIPYSLTRGDFDKLIERSGGCCMISGIPFDATPFIGSMRRPFAPSLDRIDSAQGYVVGNVRLVCVLVNLAMNQWGLEPLLHVARNLIGREREIQEKTEAWAGNPNKRRRLWHPASYICTRDYLIERYGAETPAHTQDISRWARRYCDLYGIEHIGLERRTRQRKDGSWGTEIVNAYPRSVLDAVCDEMIDSKEEVNVSEIAHEIAQP